MSSCLDCVEPNQLALLASLFAIAITEDLDSNETNTLGTFLAAVGGVMQTIAAQQQLLSTRKSS